MARWVRAAMICMLALPAAGKPAAAGGDWGPFSFLYHRYGDDMYAPPITPDRPYWHGDDAVPPSLRWHDRAIEVVDEYGFTVGTTLPPEPIVAVPAPPAALAPVRRRRVVRAVRRHPSVGPVCPPTRVPAVAVALPPAEPLPDLPPVPAPTEH